jgi:hypothetical protein
LLDLDIDECSDIMIPTEASGEGDRIGQEVPTIKGRWPDSPYPEIKASLEGLKKL